MRVGQINKIARTALARPALPLIMGVIAAAGLVRMTLADSPVMRWPNKRDSVNRIAQLPGPYPRVATRPETSGDSSGAWNVLDQLLQSNSSESESDDSDLFGDASNGDTSPSQTPSPQTTAPQTAPLEIEHAPSGDNAPSPTGPTADGSATPPFTTSNPNADASQTGASTAGTPSGPRTFHVPMANSSGERIAVEQTNGLISLIVRDASLNEVLNRLAETHGFNIVTAESLNTKLTFTLDQVTLEQAMDAILSIAGYTWVRKDNIVFVTNVSGDRKLAPDIQDRKLEVFHLDFASAEDLQPIVTGMLSPLGNAYILTSDDADNRKTQESIVVEDLPGYLHDVRQFLAQMDIPPRQVLIEAHVLQVDLKADQKHGVNFEHLFNLSSNGITLRTHGFANESASQAFFVNLSGGELTALLECLKATTDAKTLASPRIVVVNGQTARIQVGEQLGFRVTTTTETSTSESVEFLDVGVVLEVTPRIAQTGMVTMRVRPEVSKGEVNPDTGLPEESTTELETDVALYSGQGLVIGGLIQEIDSDLQSKIPFLGDLNYVGGLFQRRDASKLRKEIVIAMVPRVIPFDPCTQAREDSALMAANTPLVHGALQRYPRPWEAQLPDSKHNPIVLRLPPVPGLGLHGFSGGFGKSGFENGCDPEMPACELPAGQMPSNFGTPDAGSESSAIPELVVPAEPSGTAPVEHSPFYNENGQTPLVPPVHTARRGTAAPILTIRRLPRIPDYDASVSGTILR